MEFFYNLTIFVFLICSFAFHVVMQSFSENLNFFVGTYCCTINDSELIKMSSVKDLDIMF